MPTSWHYVHNLTGEKAFNNLILINKYYYWFASWLRIRIGDCLKALQARSLQLNMFLGLTPIVERLSSFPWCGSEDRKTEIPHRNWGNGKVHSVVGNNGPKSDNHLSVGDEALTCLLDIRFEHCLQTQAFQKVTDALLNHWLLMRAPRQFFFGGAVYLSDGQVRVT